MTEKVLFVDDDERALEGYKRILYRDFKIETAIGGAAGIKLLLEQGPFAVIISDMRMPEMDGAAFLAKAKLFAPDSVRMILTGYADISSAIDAVNNGAVFRFLTKPCDKAVLVNAIQAGFKQHHLITSEKALLEDTLRGAVKVLAEVFSLVNPLAFSRALRMQRYVQHMLSKRKTSDPWRYEIAALLSQLGCVSLDTELLDDVYMGRKISADEQARYDEHPKIARDLLINIPRMEEIAEIIGMQNLPPHRGNKNRTISDIERDFGVEMLRIAAEYDRQVTQGIGSAAAIADMRDNKFTEDHLLLEALADFEPVRYESSLIQCLVGNLKDGMIIKEDVRTNTGTLLVAKGQEVTRTVVMRLKVHVQRKSIPDSVWVITPPLPS